MSPRKAISSALCQWVARDVSACHGIIGRKYFKFHYLSRVRVNYEEPFVKIFLFTLAHGFDNQVHVLRIIVGHTEAVFWLRTVLIDCLVDGFPDCDSLQYWGIILESEDSRLLAAQLAAYISVSNRENGKVIWLLWDQALIDKDTHASF